MTEDINNAKEMFNRKMSQPQYSSYVNDKEMQDQLFLDCLQQTISAREVNGKQNGI